MQLITLQVISSYNCTHTLRPWLEGTEVNPCWAEEGDVEASEGQAGTRTSGATLTDIAWTTGLAWRTRAGHEADGNHNDLSYYTM